MAIPTRGTNVIIDLHSFDELVGELIHRGYTTIGPRVHDGAIVFDSVRSAADLPSGWHDDHVPGSYRLHHDLDEEMFGWAVGPQSPKRFFFPPNEVLWRASMADGDVAFETPLAPPAPVALIGIRPCELAGLAITDRVFAEGAAPDSGYVSRRQSAFLLTVECSTPGATCFCSSMGSGPAAQGGFDLALFELGPRRPLDNDQSGSDPRSEHRFVVRVGSDIGASVLNAVTRRIATAEDVAERGALLDNAAAQMTRHLDAEAVPSLLARNLAHPRWDEVGERCLSCGNCTLVCPTCFCSDVDDVSDLAGMLERKRRWASCFDLQHSFLHGGPVRTTSSSRYRQWATHKLSTWYDQFGSSGCVGCGRCITWCPVGIDLTEEVAAIRVTDGARGSHQGGVNA